MQIMHRKSCATEQCIIAFETYGLLPRQDNKQEKRARRTHQQETVEDIEGNQRTSKMARPDDSGSCHSNLDPTAAVFVPRPSLAIQEGVSKTGDKVEVGDLNPLAAEFVPQVGEVDTVPAGPSGLVERATLCRRSKRSTAAGDRVTSGRMAMMRWKRSILIPTPMSSCSK